MSLKQFSTACTVNGGKLKLFDREAYDLGMRIFGDGEDLELHIEAVGRKRTHAQNRFFHGPILTGFMKAGWGKQEAKNMLCLLLIPDDVELPDGSIVRVPGHTSALDVTEFNDLIDGSLRIAAEEDIYIEDADEWRRKQWAA